MSKLTPKYTFNKNDKIISGYIISLKKSGIKQSNLTEHDELNINYEQDKIIIEKEKRL